MTIDEYVKKAKEENIPLVDVRPKEEYDEGHIPGAVNMPFLTMGTADVKPGSYLYCVSGYHSNLAQMELKRRGIPATAIGGIENYTGPIEK